MGKVLTDFEKHAARMDSYLLGASKLSEEHFHKPPTAGAWSAQQVILHLIIASEGILSIMTKKVSEEGKLKKSDASMLLRAAFLTLMLRLPLKFKAPALVANVPNDLTFQELKDRWDKNKEGYRKLISNFPAHLEDKLIFKHPAVGWFNLEQSISFLGEHILYHKKQIETLYS